MQSAFASFHGDSSFPQERGKYDGLGESDTGFSHVSAAGLRQFQSRGQRYLL